MNRAVDLNSPFIETVNLVYFIQEKAISNLNKKNTPTTNSGKFLNKTSKMDLSRNFKDSCVLCRMLKQI